MRLTILTKGKMNIVTQSLISLFTLGAIQLVSWVAAPLAQSQVDPNRYIGLTFSELPSGLKSEGGWMITASDTAPEYTGKTVWAGQTQMFWFSRIVARDRTGSPAYQVVDAIKLPAIAKSRLLVGGFCQVNGVGDPGIIAVVKPTNTEYYTQVDQAWRANPKTEKIQPLNPKGVACANAGWGV
jgi:hypothetical protein